MTTLYDFVNNLLYRLDDTKQEEISSPKISSISNILNVINPENIDSGTQTGFIEIQSGGTKQGKTKFDNNETGFILGVDSTDGLSKFYIGNTTNYLNWTGTALNIAGSITATTGTIGGFTIGTDYIRDVANSMGMASTVTGGDDVRFWAGDTFANRATAPFRVTEAGSVAASNFSMTGGSVGASVNVALGALNVAARGWTQTSVFSVTDADTVAWGAGTFTSADGTSYSITGSNTGNMAAPTYIYLDTAVSTTAYQTTTTAGTAVGAGKVLIAKAENGTGEATFQVFGGIGGQNINASSIVANSITANELSTSITYAGSIIIDSAGLIRSGQTAYRTGTGWFIGNVTGTPKLSIGIATTGPEMYWDGTSLNSTNLNILRTFTAGEALTTGDIVYPTGNNIVERIRPTSFATNSATFTEPDTSSADFVHKIYKIDNTRTLHLTGGSISMGKELQAFIGTTNANEDDITYGSVYSFSTANCNAFDVCQFDTYKFLVIYERSNATTDVLAVVLDVGSSGNTITAGTIKTIDTDFNDASEVSCAALDTSRVALTYFDGGDSKNYIHIVSISGTTITTNTPVVFSDNGNQGQRGVLCKLDTDKLLLVYTPDASDTLRAATIDVSGTTPTVNADNVINASTYTYNIGLDVISSTKVAMVYTWSDGGADRKVKTTLLTISGSTVTKGTDLQLATIDQCGYYINIVAISETVWLTATRESDTEIKYHLIYNDGGTLTSTATQSITTSSNTYQSTWVCKFKPFKYLGAAGTQYSFVTLGSTANKFIGSAYENIIDTNTGLVAMRFTTNTTFSGLTAGSIYYIDDSGQPSTDNSTLSVTFGIAINTTSILVQ